MSSILKALKKLEEEKALRREGALDLPREILVARREKRRVSPFTWGGAIVASLLLTIALTALIVGRRTDHQSGARPAGVTATSATPVETGTEPDRKPTASNSTKAPGPASPAPARKQVPPAAPAAIKSPSPEATVPAPERSASPTLPELPATAPQLPVPARKPAPSAGNEPAEAGLTVSGIAWNKDSADRLAIINGQPMATGTTVNGFVVEEILPDRVRFSAAGKTIEIPFGKQGKSN